MRGGRVVVEAFFSDDTGRMKAMWFNQPYVVSKLEIGEEYVISGKVTRRLAGAGLAMMNPAFERGARVGPGSTPAGWSPSIARPPA